MKTKVLKYLLILVLCLPSPVVIGGTLANIQAYLINLIEKIPARPFSAMTGSEFARSVFSLDDSRREQAILAQIMEGNLPDFLRKLKPVQLVHRFEDGKTTTATIFVTPDYLAIGSDKDFLSIPMSLYTATEIAAKFGFTLPTRVMVDAIFNQSVFHLAPKPMPPGPRMRSTQYYLEHNRKIQDQRSALCCPLDALISGNKKDVVLTNRLTRALGRIAIYGWHRLSGDPIQPLSTVHGATYADYSHGIRLVSDTVLIDNEPRSIYDVLEDPRLARILTDEGPIPKARRLMALHHY
jgi:hypothetical protein